jgi:monoamine oxidase
VLRLNNMVKEIHWKQTTISIITNKATYKAKQVIVTLPLGVWQIKKGSKAAVAFIPDLPEKRKGAKQLGFGGVIKFALQFNEIFWRYKANRIGFILSDETIPTWWTQHPDENPMLSGWIAGSAAEKLKDLSNAALLQKAITSLANIFDIKPAQLKQRLVAHHVFNWIAHPFAKGAYAYQVIDTKQQKQLLAAPVDDRLFFAGEAIYQGSEMGTVEAALASGVQVAKQVLARNSIVRSET